MRYLYFFSLFIFLISCSPVKRHTRLVQKYPFVHADSISIDTVKIVDSVTILTPTYHFDTIILRDTFTIENERLKLVYERINDTTFINVDCKGDTIFVPVEKLIIKEKKTVQNELPEKKYRWLWVILGAFLLIGIGFFFGRK